MSAPVSDRFWSKVSKGDGCWEWTAGLGGSGYGRFFVGGRRAVPAHRYAYEAVKGAIPDGLLLDHLCRNRTCVRPDHLEPVTNAENLRRSDLVLSTQNAARTECLRGHRYTPESTYVYRGWRRCKPCYYARAAAYRERIRRLSTGEKRCPYTKTGAHSINRHGLCTACGATGGKPEPTIDCVACRTLPRRYGDEKSCPKHATGGKPE